jgi:hypothetical protein
LYSFSSLSTLVFIISFFFFWFGFVGDDHESQQRGPPEREKN